MNWGKEAKAGDAASRSIMKAFAWRAFAMVNTLIISLFFAKNVKVGASVGQGGLGRDGGVRFGFCYVGAVWCEIGGRSKPMTTPPPPPPK